MNVHELEGCAPTPLASYLKAIGVLRLLSEQVDPEARGFWRAERFVLVTRLDTDALLDFFLSGYQPTPMLSPWNGGSGFYPGDNTTGLDALARSVDSRFAPYRKAISDVRRLVGERESRPDKAEKASFVRRCRAEWSDQQLPWLNAALAVLGDDVAFPALLGTGGNDGRLDFTNNFMQRLAELLIDMDLLDRQALLQSSLFDAAVTGMEKNAVGQFHPGGAGGMNAGPGFDAPSVVNSWDFVLLLEGALAIQVAAVRQLDSASLPVAAAPFAFRARAAGYGSATRSEESARGEQWFPLWERPMRYTELQAILREGRMQTSRGARATGAIDAAKALAAHGTSRGITAFQRYGYIERNGLSNLAVPLGRWEVRASPAVRLVDEIDGWLGSLRRASRDPAKDPESLRRQVRRIEGRVLALLQSGGRRPQLVQDLLIALGEADQGLLTRPKHTSEQRLRPLQGLSTSWVEAIDDEGPEVRLAVAFATQGSRSLPLRRHIVPTERGSVFLSGPNGLMLGPELCWTGRDLVDDLVQIVLRRLSTGEKGEGLDLRPNGYTAALSDVQAFLLGRVDDARLSGLIRALFGLRRRQKRHRMSAERAHTILPAFALVRSGFPGRAIPETPLEPGRDTRAAVDLAHGRAHRASEVLARRLAARGVRLRLERIVAERPLSRRLLASLAFPLSDRDMRRVLASVAYPDRNASPEGAEP